MMPDEVVFCHTDQRHGYWHVDQGGAPCIDDDHNITPGEEAYGHLDQRH